MEFFSCRGMSSKGALSLLVGHDPDVILPKTEQIVLIQYTLMIHVHRSVLVTGDSAWSIFTNIYILFQMYTGN